MYSLCHHVISPPPPNMSSMHPMCQQPLQPSSPGGTGQPIPARAAAAVEGGPLYTTNPAARSMAECPRSLQDPLLPHPPTTASSPAPKITHTPRDTPQDTHPFPHLGAQGSPAKAAATVEVHCTPPTQQPAAWPSPTPRLPNPLFLPTNTNTCFLRPQHPPSNRPPPPKHIHTRTYLGAQGSQVPPEQQQQ